MAGRKGKPLLDDYDCSVGDDRPVGTREHFFSIAKRCRRDVELNLTHTGKSDLGQEGYRKFKEQKAEEYKECCIRKSVVPGKVWRKVGRKS